jgi:hypothetical protein
MKNPMPASPLLQHKKNAPQHVFNFNIWELSLLKQPTTATRETTNHSHLLQGV